MAKRETSTDRGRIALDLFALSEKLTRARLRRQHPRATAAALETMYVDLLQAKSDAKWPTVLKARSRRSRET